MQGFCGWPELVKDELSGDKFVIVGDYVFFQTYGSPLRYTQHFIESDALLSRSRSLATPVISKALRKSIRNSLEIFKAKLFQVLSVKLIGVEHVGDTCKFPISEGEWMLAY